MKLEILPAGVGLSCQPHKTAGQTGVIEVDDATGDRLLAKWPNAFARVKEPTKTSGKEAMTK